MRELDLWPLSSRRALSREIEAELKGPGTMTIPTSQNGHDKAAQLRQLNREYQPLLAALSQKASATHANKLAQMEYHRRRKAILNGDDEDHQELRT
jgi:hypothetical protein